MIVFSFIRCLPTFVHSRAEHIGLFDGTVLLCFTQSRTVNRESNEHHYLVCLFDCGLFGGTVLLCFVHLHTVLLYFVHLRSVKYSNVQHYLAHLFVCMRNEYSTNNSIGSQNSNTTDGLSISHVLAIQKWSFASRRQNFFSSTKT